MACSRTAFGLSEFSQSMSDGINDESIVAATAVAPGGPTSSPSRQIRRGSSWNRSGRLNNERKVLEDPLGILLGHLHEQDPVHDSAEQASRDLVVDIQGDAGGSGSRLETEGLPLVPFGPQYLCRIFRKRRRNSLRLLLRSFASGTSTY